MARAERQVPAVYFGRPGALVTLPWPRGDQDRSYERLTFDFPTGSGQHMVSSLVGGSRSYAVNWNALHVDTYAAVEQYWTGNMGSGPWAYIDPALTNLLRPNQASSTNAYYDTRHWTTLGGSSGSLFSNSTVAQIHRVGATRSLEWRFPVAAATNPELNFAYPYRSWFGFPVVPGLSYAWAAWVKPDGTIDTSITAQMKIKWVDAAGVQVTDIGDTAAAVTGWTRRSLIGVAPAGTAYAQPRFVLTGATITTGGSLFVDEPLFEQDTVLNNWAPGGGIRPVEIIGLNDSDPFETRFRKSPTMLLRELAP
jgi:hypothetical protein